LRQGRRASTGTGRTAKLARAENEIARCARELGNLMLARGWAGALPRALATGVAYAAAALLGVWLGRAGGSVAAFWPANTNGHCS
jgi:hypothetical protein